MKRLMDKKWVKLLKRKIMKQIITAVAIFVLSLSCAMADDKPVSFDLLPAQAQTFVNANYPGEKVLYITVDDDLIRPDYKVVLVNGVEIQFNYDGSLEKIESKKAGVPESLVPAQILSYVRNHYPDAFVTEYEIGTRHYEVKLSNRLELTFNKHFQVIELDD